MTRWELLARRIVVWTAAAAGGLLLLAMILSYSGLRAFYLGAGLPVWSASLYPLTVDLLALVGYVALLVLRHKAYPLAVVAGTVSWSAWAQGYHLSHGGVTSTITSGRVIFLAGASAMVCAGLAGHLLWRILERALPADFVTAMQQTEPVERVANPVTAHASRPSLGTPAGRQLLHPDPAELVRTLADYPGLAAVPDPTSSQTPAAGTPRPAQISRTVAPSGKSQETGPCDPRCTLHAGAVGKSTRYRCKTRLDREAAESQESHNA